MSTLGRKAHELLSREVMLPLSQVGRAARPAHRAAALACREGLRFRRGAAAWGEAQRRAWVLGRLREAVRRAARETAYYRGLFSTCGFDPLSDFSFADFARLPVLERADVRRAGRDLVSPALDAAQLQKDMTGGSTGEPTTVWLGPEERGWRESALEHYMRRIGAPTGVPTAYLWGHHLDPVARQGAHDRLYDFKLNVRWFDCFRLSPEVLERYHRAFEEWRPFCVIAYASALGALAEHVLERGHRPRYPRGPFVTGAEKLLPTHRAAAERAFGRPVHERYGGRDVGLIAFQLNPAEGLDYEVDWANVLVEPETGEAESPVLVTKLHADGMPMLRYRVGDVGRFPAGARPGEPAFALCEVVGRETDRLWLPGGGWVSGLQIPHMMKDYPVREFMLTQRADYSVLIQVVARGGFGEESRRGIVETVAANLPGVEVTLEQVGEIPRTKASKWRPVVSEIEPARREVAR